MADEDSISYDEIRARVPARIRAQLQAFDFAHLPAELQAVSKPFCDLAHLHAAASGATPASDFHLEHGLQRLLEAKDAIVRSALAR